MAKRCSARVRHWFTYHGQVGIPRRNCFYCGAVNPRLAQRLKAIGWSDSDLADFEARR